MRKEKTFTVETGRDAGKTFLIREMPVIQAGATSFICHG